MFESQGESRVRRIHKIHHTHFALLCLTGHKSINKPKKNLEQYDKVTGAVDFRGRRPSEDGMRVEGVDFDKILALLPLKMLIFLQFIPAKEGFHSSASLKLSRDARAEALSRQKEIFLVQVVLLLHKCC